MATTIAFSLCSLLMAALFGYSASVQLNDPGTLLSLMIFSAICVSKASFLQFFVHASDFYFIF